MTDASQNIASQKIGQGKSLGPLIGVPLIEIFEWVWEAIWQMPPIPASIQVDIAGLVTLILVVFLPHDLIGRISGD